MKILIISNSNNLWVKSFVNNIIDEKHDVYMLSNDTLKEEYKAFYSKQNIKFLGVSNKIFSIPKIGTFLRLRDFEKHIKEEKMFDLAIILNVSEFRLTLWNNVKNIISKTIILYWGSDIHRVEPKKLHQQNKYLNSIDNIVFTTQNLCSSFKKVFGNAYDDKLSIIPFGLDALAPIALQKGIYSSSQIKEQLGMGSEITISIGYCGNPEQQHEKVIEAISTLEPKYKDDICLIYQFMYNTKKEYRDRVIRKTEQYNLKYIVFDKFLSPDEISKLRLATDVFINAQTTDALSGSVIETLYAGAILVSGEWLDYPELSDWGISYYTFSDFDILPQIVCKILDTHEYEIKCDREILNQKIGWDICKKKWYRLLEEKQ